MENALTDQDDMSADVPLAEASVSDPEICRRFEAVCEEKLQRRTKWLLLFILGALVLGVCWISGALHMIQGWYAESTMSPEQLDRHYWKIHPEFMASSILGSTVAPPDPLTTLFSWIQRNLAPILALLFGFFVVLWMITNEVRPVWFRRCQRRLRDGVRRFGLYACPKCGCDTRSDVKNCTLCREIISDHVPPFWRHYILADPNFEKYGLPILFNRLGLFQRFPGNLAPNPRRGLFWICFSVIFFAGLWFLMKDVPILSFPYGALPGLFILPMIKGVSLLHGGAWRISSSGFCPHCQHEQMIENSIGRCSECGQTYMEGELLYAVPTPFRFMLSCIALGVFLSTPFIL